MNANKGCDAVIIFPKLLKKHKNNQEKAGEECLCKRNFPPPNAVHGYGLSPSLVTQRTAIKITPIITIEANKNNT